MIGEGADIIDVGAELTRPGAVAVSEADELARLEPVVTALARARRGVVDRYLQGPRRGARDRARRDPDQRRMGPAARSRDGRHRRRKRSRGGHHAQPGGKGSRARHRRRHAALLRSFPRARRQGRNPRRAYHPRSRNRIREDVATEHRSRATARRAARLRASDSGRRVAQEIPRAMERERRRKASAPERSPPVLPPQRPAHHCSGCTMSPSMSRRCRCSTRSAAPAEITSAGNW